MKLEVSLNNLTLKLPPCPRSRRARSIFTTSWAPFLSVEQRNRASWFSKKEKKLVQELEKAPTSGISSWLFILGKCWSHQAELLWVLWEIRVFFAREFSSGILKAKNSSRARAEQWAQGTEFEWNRSRTNTDFRQVASNQYDRSPCWRRARV